MPKKNSVPYGWRSLQAVGTRVEGTRFIAFKVPLKGVINQRLTPNQKFTPKDLIAEIRAQGEELGIVIDLTNTNRYYEVKDLPKNVSYQKLPTAGLEVPDDDAILQFKKIVRKFLRQNQDNDKLIGVHCTTGLSRTGYLICRYLVDVDGWNPDVSMKAFQESRGLPLDGRVYVADLKVGKHRTNEGIDDFDPNEEGGPVVGPVAVTQFEDPARTEWSERPYPVGQPWDDIQGQRDLGQGDVLNPFQAEQVQYGLNEKMRMEGYEVFNRPDPRPRIVHGRLSDGDQAPKRNFVEEDFHRPGQRPGPFPDERYDFESGRNLEMYSSQHFARQPNDSRSFEELKGQTSMDEKHFHGSRPDQRARPFPLENRDFREGGSQDAFAMPQGQRQHYGYPGHDDFKAQGQLDENDFHDSRPGQRFRPPIEGESRGFPPERVRNAFDSTPGQRPKSLMNDFQAERQTEDVNRGRSFHGRDARILNMDAQTEDGEFSNYGPGPELRRYSGPQGRPFEAVQAEEDFSKRGYQRREPPYGHSISHGNQNDGTTGDNFYSDRNIGQRPFRGPQSRDLEMDSQIGNPGVSYNENQLRMRLPPDSRSSNFKMPSEVEDTDFISSGVARRGKPVQDFAPRDRNPEEGGFPNSGPGQRQYSIYDNPRELPDRGYTRPGPRAFESQSQSSFPPEHYSESGPGYPASGKRMRISDEPSPGDRFAPYGPSMGLTENQRRYERPPFDRPTESGSAPFNYGPGVAERQKFTTEGNFRERPGLPRKSRFN
ncbi:uncharacterized protein LOC144755014 [Lissotriton helveticus]